MTGLVAAYLPITACCSQAQGVALGLQVISRLVEFRSENALTFSGVRVLMRVPVERCCRWWG